MTTTNVVASNPQDARAVEAVEQHHTELAGRLAALTGALLTGAGRSDRTGSAEAQRAAVRFCTEELLPHARAEEEALYPAAARSERARLLVDGMLAEHTVIARLVEELAAAAEPVGAAAAGYALRVLFDAHLAKENDLVLPIVAADPAVSLAAVLDGMHDLLGHTGSPDDEQTGHGHGGCGCGESDAGVPELDVRAMRQLGERADGHLDVAYLERGPQAWRLQLTRS